MEKIPNIMQAQRLWLIAGRKVQIQKKEEEDENFIMEIVPMSEIKQKLCYRRKGKRRITCGKRKKKNKKKKERKKEYRPHLKVRIVRGRYDLCESGSDIGFPQKSFWNT